jgi:hypothetical protein
MILVYMITRSGYMRSDPLQIREIAMITATKNPASTGRIRSRTAATSGVPMNTAAKNPDKVKAGTASQSAEVLALRLSKQIPDLSKDRQYVVKAILHKALEDED